jgi:CRP-like cAMP-binding protein
MTDHSARRLHDSDSTSAPTKGLSCSDIVWEGTADCRHCPVRQQALFSALRGSDFDQMFSPIRSAIVPAGTVLYTESAPADAIYTVRWGVVKLSKRAPDGVMRIVRLLGPSAAVGLEGLQEGLHWHTATTLQQTGLCRIPFQVIDQLQAQNAQVAERLVMQWERYVEYADRWITDLTAGSVKTRVYRLIKLLVEVTSNTSGEIELPSVHDLAAVLGTSVESVSRATAELKRDEVLTRIAPRTYRCDLGALSC